MSSPRERLQALLESVTPSKIKFVASHNASCIQLRPVVVEPYALRYSADPLQVLLQSELQERFDSDQARFIVSSTAENLFAKIKGEVSYSYDKVSTRCKATKNKTQTFFHRILLEESHLANYIICMYIEVHSASWVTKTPEAKRLFFEPLESLRRVYGKKR